MSKASRASILGAFVTSIALTLAYSGVYGQERPTATKPSRAKAVPSSSSSVELLDARKEPSPLASTSTAASQALSLSLASQGSAVARTVVPTESKIQSAPGQGMTDEPSRQSGNGAGYVALILAAIALAVAGVAVWLGVGLQRSLRGIRAEKSSKRSVQQPWDADLLRDRWMVDLQAALARVETGLRAEWKLAIREAIEAKRAPIVPAGAGAAAAPPISAPRVNIPSAAPVAVPETQVRAEGRSSDAVSTEEVLSCIERLSKDGAQITEANAVMRILAAMQDGETKALMRSRNFRIQFFTAAGDPSSINVELLGWAMDGDAVMNVVPHPQAGRVGQFNKWFMFKDADYATQPVLASQPALARIESGKLIPVKMGRLRWQ